MEKRDERMKETKNKNQPSKEKISNDKIKTIVKDFEYGIRKPVLKIRTRFRTGPFAGSSILTTGSGSHFDS
jgi:hypothetical protein